MNGLAYSAARKKLRNPSEESIHQDAMSQRRLHELPPGVPTRTLRQILEIKNHRTQVEQAIKAAFLAGQADMRGRITQDIAVRFQGRKPGRYHNIEAAAVAFVVGACPMINGNFLAGRRSADSGAAEAAEILAWDFAV